MVGIIVAMTATMITSTNQARRKALGWTRPEFAELLGVPTPTLRSWETGERNPRPAGHFRWLRLLQECEAVADVASGKGDPELLEDLGLDHEARWARVEHITEAEALELSQTDREPRNRHEESAEPDALELLAARKRQALHRTRWSVPSALK